MKQTGHDSLKTRRTLTVGGTRYDYFSLPEAGQALGLDVSRLPASLKVLLENVLRFENGGSYTTDDARAIAEWAQSGTSNREVPFRPARILMQDFTGVPAVVDLAAMRDGIARLGGSPDQVNPLVPVDLVIDHSVMVDVSGRRDALHKNEELEFDRNRERYQFLRWGQGAFQDFRVVPPGSGICHQVNVEYLAQVVWTGRDDGGQALAYPDTLFGTDSHTTMANGIGVLGWGVGGIEAEAAMLGQPIAMLIPDVVGFRFTGRMPEGSTATDLALTVTQMLRRKGVVGKFVEFFGPGLDSVSVATRLTIANMAPEYGATCGFFPVDAATLDYMRLTNRSDEQVALTEAYCRAQGLWREDMVETRYTSVLELDLGTVQPSLAGPKRPQDRVPLKDAAAAFNAELTKGLGVPAGEADRRIPVPGTDYEIGHGNVVIAAITSCTNTSNPYVMLAAGLLAKKARERGLAPKPWVKTSLAPGSKVVTDYLDRAGLSEHLDALGFQLVGYGCTTCIGNSGPLDDSVSEAIEDGKLVAVSVLSGNRNFEGRIHPLVRANYLASPPLVVAYALLGTMTEDLATTPLGTDAQGTPVFLRDLWPSDAEIAEAVRTAVARDEFEKRYSEVFEGTELWKGIEFPADSETYRWNSGSTYVQNPPYFDGITMQPVPVHDITGARILALFSDNITTDHISPAGSIKKASPAGDYLTERQVGRGDFNSYGSRRGNHEVMMRGTFANIRIKNEMVPGVEGGWTRHEPDGEQMPIYDAAMRYKAEGVPLVVFAGKEYGMGSSRDWAAKGTALLGVKAVVVESFERIHRSNLVGMGVLPLQFKEGTTRQSLGLTGGETIDVLGLETLAPRGDLTLVIHREDGRVDHVPVLCRVDTADEVEYYRNGGILHYVLREMARAA
jgi:aconitate hydratase